MEAVEVACFEGAGDVRRMSVARQEGFLVVSEDVSGPSALVAYGEDERSLRATFAPGEVDGLLGAVRSAGAGSLEEYLSRRENDIVDLMDLCDGLGVPYAFSSEGPGGVLQFRPARRSDQGPGAPPAIRLG